MGVEKNVGREGKDEKRKINALKSDTLSGTTRQTYRYIYKRGPVRLHEIQRDLQLSSSSVADYHIKKLLRMGLIREEGGQDGAAGYVAEEAVFEAMLRIRQTVIPLWTTASAFFAAALFLLVTILRPGIITSSYLFSLIVTGVALSICAYETFESLNDGGVP